MEEAARDRVAALREFRDLGWSLGDISNVTGISRPRLHRCCVFELTGGQDIVGPDLFPEADLGPVDEAPRAVAPVTHQRPRRRPPRIRLLGDISRIERGTTSPTWKTLQPVLAALDALRIEILSNT